MLTIIIATALFTSCLAQFNGGDASWYCNLLAQENCLNHHLEPRCSTTNVTYRNMCDLGKAHCKDSSVNQAHLGPCTGFVTTTPNAEQVVHGSEIILDFQCAAISHRECTHSIGEKICGTDGVTYEDFCEYEKSRCTHRELHVAKLGDCSA